MSEALKQEQIPLIFRVAETVPGEDVRECFGEPRTVRGVGTLDRSNRMLETRPRYESITKRKSLLPAGGGALSEELVDLEADTACDRFGKFCVEF